MKDTIDTEDKHLFLWLAIEEATTKIYDTAKEYSIKADKIANTEPINSVNIRAQAIGLLAANQILGESLRNRNLLPSLNISILD